MEVNKKQWNSSALAALCFYRLFVAQLNTFVLHFLCAVTPARHKTAERWT